MIDKATAIKLGESWGSTTVYHVRLLNADGTALRARTNGKCKVWKTRPEDYRLPMKHGMRDCFYIDPSNAEEWTLTEPK